MRERTLLFPIMPNQDQLFGAAAFMAERYPALRDSQETTGTNFLELQTLGDWKPCARHAAQADTLPSRASNGVVGQMLKPSDIVGCDSVHSVHSSQIIYNPNNDR